MDLPAPRNIRKLWSFLGSAGWYRRFIPNFATVAEPLFRLLKKAQPFDWQAEQEAAFEAIKTVLTTAPVVARPDFAHPFTLQTDASSTGVGAVLTQTIEGVERVIAYASRSLSAADRNYSVTVKECLAVVWAIKKFREYLEGFSFTVVTDHSSLRWLRSLKDPTGRLAR